MNTVDAVVNLIKNSKKYDTLNKLYSLCESYKLSSDQIEDVKALINGRIGLGYKNKRS